MNAATTSLTVTRDLSTMPPAAGGASRGFSAGTTLLLGPTTGWSDLGERRSLLYPADPVDPLVVTLLRPSPAADARQALVVRLHTEIAGRLAGSGDWAAGSDLRGVPSWVGLVHADDGSRWVAVSETDLAGHGFYSFSDIVTGYWDDFCDLPTARQIGFVQSLLRSAAAFDDLSYVHGAIDADAMRLQPVDGTVVLAGIGSGALLGSGRRQVCSVGAVGEFHPPELIDPAGPRPELASQATDLWSVGVAIFYLLFGVHPLYFLPDLGRRTVEQYLKANSWPAAPSAATVSGRVDPDFVRRFDAAWSQLPDEVAGTFRQLVENGWARPSSRPTVADWVAAFRVALGPPSFRHVTVGSALVIEGGDVSVSWETADADEVEIVGYGRFPATGTTRLAPRESRHLDLRAHGALGTATATTRHIEVVTVGGGGSAPATPTTAVDDAAEATTATDADDTYNDAPYNDAGSPGLDAERDFFLSDVMFGGPLGHLRLFDPEPQGLELLRPDEAPPTSAQYAQRQRGRKARYVRPSEGTAGRHQPKAE